VLAQQQGLLEGWALLDEVDNLETNIFFRS
jgi:hypothetical protein